jgi:hypothetical protein
MPSSAHVLADLEALEHNPPSPAPPRAGRAAHVLADLEALESQGATKGEKPALPWVEGVLGRGVRRGVLSASNLLMGIPAAAELAVRNAVGAELPERTGAVVSPLASWLNTRDFLHEQERRAQTYEETPLQRIAGGVVESAANPLNALPAAGAGMQALAKVSAAPATTQAINRAVTNAATTAGGVSATAQTAVGSAQDGTLTPAEALNATVQGVLEQRLGRLGGPIGELRPLAQHPGQALARQAGDVAADTLVRNPIQEGGTELAQTTAEKVILDGRLPTTAEGLEATAMGAGGGATMSAATNLPGLAASAANNALDERARRHQSVAQAMARAFDPTTSAPVQETAEPWTVTAEDAAAAQADPALGALPVRQMLEVLAAERQHQADADPATLEATAAGDAVAQALDDADVQALAERQMSESPAVAPVDVEAESAQRTLADQERVANENRERERRKLAFALREDLGLIGRQMGGHGYDANGRLIYDERAPNRAARMGQERAEAFVREVLGDDAGARAGDDPTASPAVIERRMQAPMEGVKTSSPPPEPTAAEIVALPPNQRMAAFRALPPESRQRIQPEIARLLSEQRDGERWRKLGLQPPKPGAARAVPLPAAEPSPAPEPVPPVRRGVAQQPRAPEDPAPASQVQQRVPQGAGPAPAPAQPATAPEPVKAAPASNPKALERVARLSKAVLPSSVKVEPQADHVRITYPGGATIQVRAVDTLPLDPAAWFDSVAKTKGALSGAFSRAGFGATAPTKAQWLKLPKARQQAVMAELPPVAAVSDLSGKRVGLSRDALVRLVNPDARSDSEVAEAIAEEDHHVLFSALLTDQERTIIRDEMARSRPELAKEDPASRAVMEAAYDHFRDWNQNRQRALTPRTAGIFQRLIRRIKELLGFFDKQPAVGARDAASIWSDLDAVRERGAVTPGRSTDEGDSNAVLIPKGESLRGGDLRRQWNKANGERPAPTKPWSQLVDESDAIDRERGVEMPQDEAAYATGFPPRRPADGSRDKEPARNQAGKEPRAFAPSPNGSLTWGRLTPEVAAQAGLQPLPIRVQHGWNSPFGNGYGLEHIEQRHGDEIRRETGMSVPGFLQQAIDELPSSQVERDGRFVVSLGDTAKMVLRLVESPDGHLTVTTARPSYPHDKKTTAAGRPSQPGGDQPTAPHAKPTPADADGEGRRPVRKPSEDDATQPPTKGKEDAYALDMPPPSDRQKSEPEPEATEPEQPDTTAQAINDLLPGDDRQTFAQWQAEADAILADPQRVAALRQRAAADLGLDPAEQVAMRRLVSDSLAEAATSGNRNRWQEAMELASLRKAAGQRVARELAARRLDLSTPEGRRELILGHTAEMGRRWQAAYTRAKTKRDKDAAMARWAKQQERIHRVLKDRFGVDLSDPRLGEIFGDAYSVGQLMDAVSDVSGERMHYGRLVGYYVAGNLLGGAAVAANTTGYPLMLGIQAFKALPPIITKALMKSTASNQEVLSLQGASAAVRAGIGAIGKGLVNGATAFWTGRPQANRQVDPTGGSEEDANRMVAPVKNPFLRLAMAPFLELNRFMDETAWTVAYNGALAAAAVEAKQAGDTRSHREIIENPDAELIDKAVRWADWFTLRGTGNEAADTVLSKLSSLREASPQWLEKLAESAGPGMGRFAVNPAYFVMPFFKTIANLTIEGAKLATPPLMGALAAKRGIDALRAEKGSQERQKAVAGALKGTAYTLAGLSLMLLAQMDGDDDEPLVKGSPTDGKTSGERSMRFAVEQPRTIDGVDYSRLDPVALPLALHADFRDAMHDLQDGKPAGKVLNTLGEKAWNAMVQRQFLSGIDNLTRVQYDAEGNPKGALEKFGESVTSQLAPGRQYVSTYRRLTETERMERPRDEIERAYNPGKPTRNVFGEREKTREDTAGAAIAGLFFPPRGKASEEAQGWQRRIYDLNAAIEREGGKTWWPNPVGRSYQRNGQTVRWTDEQYDRVREAAGRYWLTLLREERALIDDPELTPAQQLGVIQRLRERANRWATGEMKESVADGVR